LIFVPLGSGSYSGGNFLLGLILFVLCIVFTFLAKKIMPRLWIGLTFLILAGYLGALNFSYAVKYFPSVEDIANYDGTIYVITNSDSLFYDTRPRNQDVLTKLKWKIIPVSVSLPPSNYHLKLAYDEKKHLVSVVEDKSLWDYKPLMYTDSMPPRVYAFWVDPTEFEGKLYYLTYVCNPNLKNLYECIDTYRIYQCELDNTLCTPLPFQYTENSQIQEMLIERDNRTNNINIYFSLGWNGESTLIGDNPRCYVDGCEILPSS
jgi:hypothetical protein